MKKRSQLIALLLLVVFMSSCGARHPQLTKFRGHKHKFSYRPGGRGYY